MTVDLTKGDGRTVDPINPYAVISLVTALLGLFPVAIVFGILAFWRPAGRGIAIAGLAIGVIEALAVATFLYGFGSLVASDDSTSDTAFADYSLPATTYALPSTAFTLPSVTTPPLAVETTVEATEESIAASPEVDETCDPTVDNHATSSDGTFMKCTYAGSTRAHWVRSVPIIDSYAEKGAKCDPSVTGLAVSPDGLDMMCISDGIDEGGYWSPGP